MQIELTSTEAQEILDLVNDQRRHWSKCIARAWRHGVDPVMYEREKRMWDAIHAKLTERNDS